MIGGKSILTKITAMRVIVSIVVCFGVFAGVSNYAVQRASQKNLEFGVVKLELVEREFDVPVSYFYWEGFVKHGNWPTPKPDRSKVDYFTIDALLPDFRPFTEDELNLWEGTERGEKVTITLKDVGSYKTFNRRLEGAEADFLNGLSTREEVMGLIHFQQGNDHHYFSNDIEEPLGISMYCNYTATTASPSCTVTSYHTSDIRVSYVYGIEHLTSWRGIHNKLKYLISQFETNSTK